jgi:TonB-linked SusC/RagA family outer membrane protein
MIQKKSFIKRTYMFAILIFTSAVIYSQNTVSGTVTSVEDGQPVPGANVLVKGTTNGASTDFDGNFTLENVSAESVLQISYLGYKSLEITVGNQTQISVQLETDSQALDEVVVVGYGTQRKSDVTGALTSVSSTDFEEQPLTRIDQAIQGRAAGVQVTQNSGAPGAGFKIRIRGANSISGNNTPLYVVDGLAVSSINSLNVNDVKSMEVLKDASATAIYGSRGSNGVVLITTKTGRKGKAKVEFESYYGVGKVAQGLRYMTPAEFARGVNHAESTEIYDASAISALENGSQENWEDRLFESAPFSNVQLSVSGGSDNVDYYVSGNYSDQDGTIVSQNYKRYGIRSNVNVKLSDKIKVGVNSYLSREDDTGVRATISTGLTWDLTTPAFDNEGNYNFTPLIPGIGNGQINPLVGPENNIRENYEHKIITNAYVNYDITDNLVLNISAGIDRSDRENNSYTSVLVNDGRARVYNQRTNQMQNVNRLTYTYDKDENHRVQVDAVYEIGKFTNVWSEATSNGFFSDATTYKQLTLGATQRTDNRSISTSLESFLGRVNYALFDKFLFTASIRADGSSKFQEGNQWGYYPSGSIAWRVSEEDFIKNSGTISNLKIRTSYGVIGSQAIQALATRNIPIIGPGVNYPFSGGTGTVGVAPSNRLANPDLTWESTTQTNVGFDLGLWNSKVNLTLDIYKKSTTDLLLDRVLPSYVGPTVIAQNVGEVENKGFDATIGWNVFSDDDWNINSTLSFSSNDNEVIALVDGETSMELGNIYYGSTFPVNPTRVEVGEPISSFRGYKFDGVYQLGDEAEAAAFGKSPGDARYVDVNGDGILTTDDITTIGDGNADYTWGWNWDVSYKNFDLNFVLLGSQGNDIYNFQRMKMMGLGASQFHAVHADYNDRWSPTNPSNYASRRDGQEFLSSQWLEDGSYVTLKNVVLGYTFDDVLNNIGVDDLRLYASAENLFIITDYTGFDPESTASGNSDVDLGIDYNAYPINRSFTLGVKMTF